MTRSRWTFAAAFALACSALAWRAWGEGEDGTEAWPCPCGCGTELNGWRCPCGCQDRWTQ